MDNYRQLLLQKSAPATRCIAQAIACGKPLQVLELCAGSSRLLFALDAADLLAHGTGVEVSPSRHQFAEAWKASLETDAVRNIESAVHTYTFDSTGLDLVVAIDGALSYLYPFDPELPSKVLREAHNCLIPGGKVLMEFDVMPADRRNALRRDGHLRTWVEGDAKDAFKYALYETLPVDIDNSVVQNISTYLPRDDSSPRVKHEHYKYFSVQELSDLLDVAGFDSAFHGGFSLEPNTSESASLVVIATKR